MNSKQRNSNKRYKQKLAKVFGDAIEGILKEILEGKTTPEKQLAELGKFRKLFEQIK